MSFSHPCLQDSTDSPKSLQDTGNDRQDANLQSPVLLPFCPEVQLSQAKVRVLARVGNAGKIQEPRVHTGEMPGKFERPGHA